MNLKRWFTKKEDHADQGFINRVLTFFIEGSELPGSQDFELLAEAGFRRNAIIHACIRKISSSAAEPKLQVMTHLPDGEVRIDGRDDALYNLLYLPNDDQDTFELVEQLIIHLMVAGNAFVYKVRPRTSGPPVQLELIRPDLIGVIPGTNRAEGRVKSYTVRVDGGSTYQSIPKEDIIHFRMPDAFNDCWGLSPLYVAARYGDIDLQASDFLRAYFKNRGIPSGLLTFDRPVQKTERDRVRDLWKEQFQGIQGWHNVSVLDANVTYTPLTSGVENMNLDVVTGQTETRICMVFGVPPILIGSMFGLRQASENTLDSSEKTFWLDTLTPMFARISRRLTRRLAVEDFGINRHIEFDLSGVQALTENKSEIRKIAIQGWRSGLLTRNRANSMIGFPDKDPLGEVYLMAGNSRLVEASSPLDEPDI